MTKERQVPKRIASKNLDIFAMFRSTLESFHCSTGGIVSMLEMSICLFSCENYKPSNIYEAFSLFNDVFLEKKLFNWQQKT